MATIEKELADAYGEIIDSEIESALSEAGTERHEFSPKFEKQMEELIRTGKPNNKKGMSKRGKRILIIAIAAVVALALTACAVPEIRESIVGFFVKVFSDHVEYSDPDVTKERIEEEYGLVPIPEGFEETSKSVLESTVVTKYEDAGGNIIKLYQIAGGSMNDWIDNENGTISECVIDGHTVSLYYSDNGAQASWLENGYYFSLSYTSYIEKNVFENWIEFVHILN